MLPIYWMMIMVRWGVAQPWLKKTAYNYNCVDSVGLVFTFQKERMEKEMTSRKVYG